MPSVMRMIRLVYVETGFGGVQKKKIPGSLDALDRKRILCWMLFQLSA